MPEPLLDVATGFLLAVTAYVSTNLDNLVLLASIAASQQARGPLLRGYAASSLIVLVLSGSFALLSLFLHPDHLGYAGLVPIALGLRMLLRPARDVAAGPAGASAQAIAVMLTANSTDTVATFGPLYAESEPLVVGTVILGFVLVSLLWGFLAVRVGARIGRSATIRRLAGKLTPLMMIAVGIYVLVDTGTDLVH